MFYTVVPILIVVVCAGPGYKFYYQESKSGLYVIVICMQLYQRQKANLSMHMYSLVPRPMANKSVESTYLETVGLL